MWAYARLDLRRRWRSLVVLGLFLAVAAAVVMGSVAGARRGDSSLDRLLAVTLPATVQATPNDPHFNWDRIAKQPYVEAVDEYRLAFMPLFEEGFPTESVDLPPVRDDVLRTIERPVVLAGRVYDPERPDEAVVTQKFADRYGVGVGTTVTLVLPTRHQIESHYNATLPLDRLRGPHVPIRVVGVVRSPWLDIDSETGRISLSPGLAAHYADNLWGSGRYAPANALVRLRDGAADLPRLRADIAKQSGYPDVVNLEDRYQRVQHSLDFEAAWMLGFAGAALVAAMFLLGQWIARYVAADADRLRTARALGLGPGQSVVAAAVGPTLSAAAGMVLAVGMSVAGSRWFPIGTAADLEPSPGVDVDPAVLGCVALLFLALTVGWTCLVARLVLGSRVERAARPSSLVGLVRRTSAPTAVQLGTRFALERGRGRTAVPVLPGIIGAVVGVAGVVTVIAFGAGLAEALDNPARFGQTWQVAVIAGYNGTEVVPSARLAADLRRLPYVEHVTDTFTGAATTPDGEGSVLLWSVDTQHDAVDTVLSSGRMPEAPDEVTVAPTTADELGLAIGSELRLVGSRSTRTLRVVGIGFVPTSVETQYHEGAWVSPATYRSLFAVPGLHQVLIQVEPSADGADLVPRLVADLDRERPNGYLLQGNIGTPDYLDQDAVAATGPLSNVRLVPRWLALFLVALSIGAVGHTVVATVRRRGRELAVLRALGLTPAQGRTAVVVQALILAVIGLGVGVPLGWIGGRALWRVVASYTPLEFVAPDPRPGVLAVAPAVLVLAVLLAAAPAFRAGRLPVATILRAE